MKTLSDTAPEVERLMFAAYRSMPPARKMKLIADAYVVARQLHSSGYRLRHPEASLADLSRAWSILALGPGPWIDRMRFEVMSPSAEHIVAIKCTTQVLDDLNIRYAIGGSLASSIHGQPRYTQDADIAVEPFPGKERSFALRFPSDEYYVDESMIRDAVIRRASFNILHLLTGFKIDVFVQKDRQFDRELLARSIKAPVFGESEGEFGLITAEDIILLKLEWYRLGGEISDRQWNDIIGVVKTQFDRLDGAYLDHWASEIGVKDLFDRVRQQTEC
jgi:hypothetical protein